MHAIFGAVCCYFWVVFVSLENLFSVIFLLLGFPPLPGPLNYRAFMLNYGCGLASSSSVVRPLRDPWIRALCWWCPHRDGRA